MTVNGQTSEQPDDERDGRLKDLPKPTVNAAVRLAQLYHGTGPDGVLRMEALIVAGRLVLVVNGRSEDMGTFEEAGV